MTKPNTPFRRNPTGLWQGYWFDLEGKRLGRATRKDFATAYYLKAKHSDIWDGRALTEELGFVPRERQGPADLLPPDSGKAQVLSRSLGPSSVSA